MHLNLRIALLVSLLLTASIPPLASAQETPAATTSATEGCRDGYCLLDQGWSPETRRKWYSASQGSRLIPKTWLEALEQPQGRGAFLDPSYFDKFGYLKDEYYGASDAKLPLGFVEDHNNSARSKIMCGTFPTMCKTGAMQQPWIGLTCAACHTNEIRHYDETTGKATTVRIEGAPTTADFFNFLSSLNQSLRATRDNDDGKFDRFAGKVLGPNATDAEKATLALQLRELAAWQTRLEQLNKANITYGPARLDAQGYILNKIVAISGSGQSSVEIPADAPASYPFIWNTSQQEKIQWNGIASNLRFREANRDDFTDYGAMVRNTSEVIGVFAHIETRKKRWYEFFQPSYRSSVRTKNLDKLERWLASLESPRWPAEIFGAPQPVLQTETGALVDGAEIYRQNCIRCHALLAADDLASPLPAIYADAPTLDKYVRMLNVSEVGTDMFLACNTFMHNSDAGNFVGRKVFWIKGERIKASDSTANMLTNTALGAMLNQGWGLVKRRIIDIAVKVGYKPPEEPIFAPEIDFLPGVSDKSKKRRAQACLSADAPEGGPPKELRAYKARPLNGIWATAPYLHNGSVPTLYDLLLPSPDPLRPAAGTDESNEVAREYRPERFYLNTGQFDPVDVGFSKESAPGAFLFEARGSDGELITGNFNSGHEYGVELTDIERRALVEYLKTL